VITININNKIPHIEERASSSGSKDLSCLTVASILRVKFNTLFFKCLSDFSIEDIFNTFINALSSMENTNTAPVDKKVIYINENPGDKKALKRFRDDMSLEKTEAFLLMLKPNTFYDPNPILRSYSTEEKVSQEVIDRSKNHFDPDSEYGFYVD